MPFNFTGQRLQNVAKLGVVSDGEVFVTDGYGTTVVSGLSNYSAFASVPVRSATGVWSVQMKDSASKVLLVEVKTMLASTHYLSVQLLPTTVASGGQLVLNWVCNVAGTPADLPASGQMNVFVMYAESSGN